MYQSSSETRKRERERERERKDGLILLHLLLLEAYQLVRAFCEGVVVVHRGCKLPAKTLSESFVDCSRFDMDASSVCTLYRDKSS